MKILIDARALQTYSAFRGIGRYIRHIIRSVGSEDDDCGFLFFKEKKQRPETDRAVFTSSPRRLITLTDRLCLTRIFKTHSCYCYHSTAYALPARFAGIRYILTVHDLTPLHFPQFFTARHRIIFKTIIRSAARADLVLANSRTTAHDLASYIHISEERIKTVYHMLDERLTEAEAIRPKFPLPSEYLLYVGGADRIKNLETLLGVIPLLKIPLVIAGEIDVSRQNELCSRLGHRWQPYLHFTGFIPDGELAYLYRHAAVFVCPSLNEGFGFPPLEALQCGTPAVVSRAGSLDEVLGDAALFVDDPFDAGEFTVRIRMLLEDSRLREEMILRGREQVKAYSPLNFKKNLLGIYRQMGS